VGRSKEFGKDGKQQLWEGRGFLGGRVAKDQPRGEQGHVRREALGIKASGRGRVKQRPNQPNSAARTTLLGFIILFKLLYIIKIIKYLL